MSNRTVRKHVINDFQRLETRRLLALAIVDANAGNTGAANDSAFGYDVSADGIYATFISRATDVIASPASGNHQQAYRRNFVTGVTDLVSVGRTGSTAASNDVLRVRSSANGRYVAFSTSATNITGADANVEQDTYFTDMRTGKMTLVSRGYVGVIADHVLGAVGGQLVAISPDGRYVAFGGSTGPDVFVDGATDANSSNDLYLWDRDTRAVRCVTFRNGTKTTGDRGADVDGQWGTTRFTPDGRYLLFYSAAANYVSGVADGSTTGGEDVFVYDTKSSAIAYVSVNARGKTSGNADSGFADISDDGNVVAFETTSSNLVPNDANGTTDILLKTRSTGALGVVSRDRAGGGVANGESSDPDLTADGRYVAYTSLATDIASPDDGPGTVEDVFRYDARTSTNLLVSINAAGTAQGNGPSGRARVSDDGNYVTFVSAANNLATNASKSDTTYDAVYVRNVTGATTTLLSVGASNVTEPQDSGGPVFSQDGSRILFKSSAANLVAGDANGTEDIFVAVTPGHDWATFVDGALIVRGTSIADAIVLTIKGSKVNVDRNGATFKFPRSAISSISIDAGDGDDNVSIGVGIGAIYALGGNGDDTLDGSGGNDTLTGAAGNDSIRGFAGDDRLDGGKGDDRIVGDDGSDRLYGGDGNDHLYGDGGVDRLTGDAGVDTLEGGSSNDKFYANDGGVDRLFGGAGTDTAVVDASKDILDSIESTT